MADFSIRVRGAKELAAMFKNMPLAAKYEFMSAASQAVAILRGTIGITYTQSNPPPLRYIRTHNLEEGWSDTVTPLASGVKAVMSNPVDYAGKVIGPDTQEELFAGRWPTTRTILESQKDTIMGLFEKARDSIVARFGK